MDEYEALLQFLYSCPHGLAQFDRAGMITMVNPAFTGLSYPLLPTGKAFGSLLDLLEPWLPELRQMLQDPMPRGMVCDGARVHLGPAAPGQDPHVLALTVVRMDPDRHMAVVSDISVQVAQERRLRESEAWFAAVMQGVDDYAVLALDEDGRVSDWNVSGERLFGLDPADVVGRPATSVVTSGTVDQAAFRHRLEEAKRDGWHLDEGWRHRADGTRFWGTCMVSPINPTAFAAKSAFSGPLSGRYMMVVRDISERRQSADELRRALTADHLTGVLNRRCFLDRAEGELKQQARRGAQGRGATSCIAMVDADRFKGINDTHGHAAGDMVLGAIAEVLRRETRECDLIGRLGGEEFAVMMPGTTLEDAEQAAERLRAGVAALRLSYGGQAIPVTVSIGVSGDGEADLKGLLCDADKALYAAKNGGRNQVCRSALAPVQPAIAAGTPILELAGRR